MMIVNVTQRTEGGVVLEGIDGDVQFEGGAAEVGVLATFERDGHQETGRVTRVRPETLSDEHAVVEVELVDRAKLDRDSEKTLAHLPPGDDTDTTI